VNVSRPLALVAVLFIALVAALPTGIRGADGVYTQQQAAAGASVFADKCASCHGAKLEGVAGPPLAGPDFMKKWQGKSADDLFYIMLNQMPADNPGSLKPDQYVAILAFVLQENGFPAGDTPLDASKIKGLTINK
jgi:mono/diheme cytochrome c family protein